MQECEQERLRQVYEEERQQQQAPPSVKDSTTSPQAKVSKTPVVNNKPAATDEEVKATCPKCGKTFRRHFNMRIHVDRVSRSEVNLF